MSSPSTTRWELHIEQGLCACWKQRHGPSGSLTTNKQGGRAANVLARGAVLPTLPSSCCWGSSIHPVLFCTSSSSCIHNHLKPGCCFLGSTWHMVMTCSTGAAITIIIQVPQQCWRAFRDEMASYEATSTAWLTWLLNELSSLCDNVKMLMPCYATAVTTCSCCAWAKLDMRGL